MNVGQTLRCIRCHRLLRNPSADGMGPVCSKRAAPMADHERDLFGYDIERAAAASHERLAVHIGQLALSARFHVRDAARAARVRCGVWA